MSRLPRASVTHLQLRLRVATHLCVRLRVCCPLQHSISARNRCHKQWLPTRQRNWPGHDARTRMAPIVSVASARSVANMMGRPGGKRSCKSKSTSVSLARSGVGEATSPSGARAATSNRKLWRYVAHSLVAFSHTALVAKPELGGVVSASSPGNTTCLFRHGTVVTAGVAVALRPCARHVPTCAHLKRKRRLVGQDDVRVESCRHLHSKLGSQQRQSGVTTRLFLYPVHEAPRGQQYRLRRGSA